MSRRARRPSQNNDLNITSMMDMMTIILVFLLKSYSTDDITVSGSDDLQLPVSSSLKPPKLAVNVIVSQSQIIVDGDPVLALEQAADESGQMVARIPDDAKSGPKILDLYDKLQSKAQQAKELGQRARSDEFDFKGQILLQCDRRLPFSIVRDVMFTAGQAQFGEFRFVVIKGSG